MYEFFLFSKTPRRHLTVSQRSLISGPLTGDLEEISSNVLSFTIDKKNNDGWTVNLKGSITHHFDFFSPEGRKEEKVHCSSVVTGRIQLPKGSHRSSHLRANDHLSCISLQMWPLPMALFWP